VDAELVDTQEVVSVGHASGQSEGVALC
jgi:hypothetical protein